MGNFKNKLIKEISGVKEQGEGINNMGGEMERDAKEIRTLLDSMSLKDSEDVKEMDNAGKEYQKSFDDAYSKNVETKGREIDKKSGEIKESAGEELENVRSAETKFESAAKVSEIGREVGEAGATKLKESGKEYEDIKTETSETNDEIQQRVEERRNRMSRIFG